MIPSILIGTEYKKFVRGKGYQKIPKSFSKKLGETDQEALKRFRNIKAYFTLSNNMASFVTELVSTLDAKNEASIDVLNDLIKQGLLQISINCK